MAGWRNEATSPSNDWRSSGTAYGPEYDAGQDVPITNELGEIQWKDDTPKTADIVDAINQYMPNTPIDVPTPEDFPKITESIEDAKARIIAESYDMFPTDPTKRSLNRSRTGYQRKEMAEDKYQRILESRGKAAQQRSKEAREMSFIKRLTMAAGREGDKLAAGLGDVVDIAGGMTGIMDEESAFQSVRDRRAMQANADEKFKEIDEELGYAAIGAVAPYMASGVLAGPITKGLASKTLGGISKGVSKAGTTVGTAADEAATAAAASRGMLGKIAGRVKRESFDPMKRQLSRVSARRPMKDPNREGIVNTLLGDTLLGAVEGGAHYDNSALEGAYASVAGSALGMTARPFVSRMKDVREAPVKEIADWAEDQGYRLMTGLKTGNKRSQAFETGLQNGSMYADALSPFNKANDQVINRIAYKAMGIIDDGKIPTDPIAKKAYFENQNRIIKGITSKELGDHVDNLKATYKSLEDSTIGQFEGKDIVALNNKYRELLKSKSPDEVRLGKELEGISHEFRGLYKPYDKPEIVKGAVDLGKPRLSRRQRRERLSVREYDGAMYDRIRSKVTDKMVKFENDPMMYKALKEVRDTLDKSIERGMGKDKLKAWNDAREKRTITKLMIDKGMVLQDNSIDLRKLGNKLMSERPFETLTGRGSERMQDLQKIAKIKGMEDAKYGSIFSSDQISGERKKQSPLHAFINSGFSKALPILPSMYVRSYLSGYPSRTGFLNMSNTLGKSLWELPGMTRALDQAVQGHPSTFNFLKDEATGLYDTVTNAPSDLYNLWRGGNDEEPK